MLLKDKVVIISGETGQPPRWPAPAWRASLPAPPSKVSAPVSPCRVSAPAPPSTTSSPAAPLRVSSPRAPLSLSAAVVPRRASAASVPASAIAMAASGACALLVGFTFGASWWLVAPVALAWGFFVIADSAQFSVLVTESVPPHAVGTALTIQTSLGFLLTTFTIQLVPPLVARFGWAWAFPALAIGPAFGIWSIRRLRAWRAGAA